MFLEAQNYIKFKKMYQDIKSTILLKEKGKNSWSKRKNI